MPLPNLGKRRGFLLMTLVYLIGYTCDNITTASVYTRGGFLLSNRYKTRRYWTVSSLSYAVPFCLTKGAL